MFGGIWGYLRGIEDYLYRIYSQAESALDALRNVNNQQELNERYERFRAAMDELNRQTGRRANDLRNAHDRDDLQVKG
jgi:hypothetical protein